MSVALIPQPPAVPTSAQVDELCEFYDELRKERDLADAKLKAAREELHEMVERYGAAPLRATKSKRLMGTKYQATLTWSHSFTVDPLGAARVHAACFRAGRPSLFKRLFTRHFCYLVAEGAEQFLDRLGEIKDAPRTLRALFHRALHIERSPYSLSVEPREKRSKEMKP